MVLPIMREKACPLRGILGRTSLASQRNNGVRKGFRFAALNQLARYLLKAARVMKSRSKLSSIAALHRSQYRVTALSAMSGFCYREV